MAENRLGIGNIPFPSGIEGSIKLPLDELINRSRDTTDYLLKPQVNSVTDTYSATDLDHTILADASSGDFTVTLPELSTVVGKILAIKNVGATGTVTVDGNASETIDGATTLGLAEQYQSVLLHAGSSEWSKVSEVATTPDPDTNTTYQLSTKIGSFTRNLADASGTSDATGVGFTAQLIFILSCVGGGNTEVSIGFGTGSGSDQRCVYSEGTNWDFTAGAQQDIIHAWQSATDQYEGNISSIHSDGFIINWVKTGSPTGTLTCDYLAIALEET